MPSRSIFRYDDDSVVLASRNSLIRWRPKLTWLSAAGGALVRHRAIARS